MASTTATFVYTHPKQPRMPDPRDLKPFKLDSRTLPVHDIRQEMASDAPEGKPCVPYNLDRHGFTVVRHVSPLPAAEAHRWYDRDALDSVYYPSITNLLQGVTGAKKLFVLSGTLRSAKLPPERSVPAESPPSGPPNMDDAARKALLQAKLAQKDGVEPNNGFAGNPQGLPSGAKFSANPFEASRPRIRGIDASGSDAQPPSNRAHIDFCTMSAKATIRKFRQDVIDEAKDIVAAQDEAGLGDEVDDERSPPNARRYAIYSVWRALEPVQRDPLGIVDEQSFRTGGAKRDSAVLLPLPSEGVTGPYINHVNFLKASGQPAAGDEQAPCMHKWHWLSDQTPDEVTLIKLFDSSGEADDTEIAGGTPHGSFHLTGTENCPARKSLEVRIIAFW